MMIDAARGKLVIVTEERMNDLGPEAEPALFRCNLDGSSCTHTHISTCQERHRVIDSATQARQGRGASPVVDCVWSPTAVLDPISSKLLVAGAPWKASGRQLELFSICLH
jgi:hypothetical protein